MCELEIDGVREALKKMEAAFGAVMGTLNFYTGPGALTAVSRRALADYGCCVLAMEEARAALGRGWTRYRFRSPLDKNEGDYRPVSTTTVQGPWWCSGEDDSGAVIIAWFPSDVALTEWWPEAASVDPREDAGPPTFTTRFPRPDWWDADKHEVITGVPS